MKKIILTVILFAASLAAQNIISEQDSVTTWDDELIIVVQKDSSDSFVWRKLMLKDLETMLNDSLQGVDGNFTGNITVGGTATIDSSLTLGSDTLKSTPVAGTFEFANDRMYLTDVGTQKAIDRTSDPLVVDVVANGDAGVDGTSAVALYTEPVPANGLKVGNIIKFHTYGTITNTAGNDIYIGVVMGTDTLVNITTQLINLGVISGSGQWDVGVTLTVRTGGVIKYHIDIHIDDQSFNMSGTDTLTLTNANDFIFSAAWATASASNVMTTTQGFMEFKN